MSVITTRPALAEDAETIFRFVCELEGFKDASYELFLQQYLKNLEDLLKIHLVALRPRNIVLGYISCYGQLLLHHMGMVYEIQEMFVEQPYRGVGVGKCLLISLEEILKNCGCVSLEATTNRVRHNTICFYQKNGFVQTHLKFVKA